MGKLSEAVLPKFIWLEPRCDGCAKHDISETGRLWCEDDVWGHCEECGLPAVKYQIVDPVAAGRAALGKGE